MKLKLTFLAVMLSVASGLCQSTTPECKIAGVQVKRLTVKYKQANTKASGLIKTFDRANSLLVKRSKSFDKYLTDTTAKIGVAASELCKMMNWGYVAEFTILRVATILKDPTIIDRATKYDFVTWRNSSVHGIVYVLGGDNGRSAYYEACPPDRVTGRQLWTAPDWGGCYDFSVPAPNQIRGQSVKIYLDRIFGPYETANADTLKDRARWLDEANRLGRIVYTLTIERSEKSKKFLSSTAALRVAGLKENMARAIAYADSLKAQLEAAKAVQLQCKLAQ